MASLSDAKRHAMALLMDRAPEEVLEAIETRFASAGGGLAADVVALARDQRCQRAALRQTFGPLVGLTAARQDGVAAPLFPRALLQTLWLAVERERPDLIEHITTRIRIDPQTLVQASVVDAVCEWAATTARNSDPDSLGLSSEAMAEDLAAYLDIVPIARKVGLSTIDWLGRLDNEQLTVLRLTFKDADAVREDGGVRLMELMMADLPRAAEVLRLISAITDQAPADFIDGTEMAGFPNRLLGHVESLSAQIRIDPVRVELAEARAVITDLTQISLILREFDLAFPAASGGAWTKRLQTVRRHLTSQLDATFRSIPGIVEKALPLGAARLAGRMSRMVPDLSADPEAPVVHRAVALLEILSNTRSLAAELGCEGTRRAAAEAVADRSDAYAEEGLRMLYDSDFEDRERAEKLIDLAAECLAQSRNLEAGALVRRRMAVACMTDLETGSAA
ncbi:MAG: hypothetical protein J0L52_05235 [Caulobacterales bacterium]|nr:hypothetical protein [Caulobacterales bacterium]